MLYTRKDIIHSDGRVETFIYTGWAHSSNIIYKIRIKFKENEANKMLYNSINSPIIQS